jgi:hypothetical protein
MSNACRSLSAADLTILNVVTSTMQSLESIVATRTLDIAVTTASSRRHSLVWNGLKMLLLILVFQVASILVEAEKRLASSPHTLQGAAQRILGIKVTLPTTDNG